MRAHAAMRAHARVGGATGSRTRLSGFAGRYLTDRTSRRVASGRGTVPTLQHPAELKSARVTLAMIPKLTSIASDRGDDWIRTSNRLLAKQVHNRCATSPRAGFDPTRTVKGLLDLRTGWFPPSYTVEESNL